MRGIALSDMHLGFRQFNQTVEGRNLREVDVEKAWQRAVDIIVMEGPDLVTIAGDVFHHPRVSDYAKRAFLTGVRRIINESDAYLVVLMGNHDAGRTADVLTPIMLAEGWDDRVFVVTTPTRINLNLRDGDTASVACFPFVVGERDNAYKLGPDDNADYNILVLHAAVKGSSEGDRLPYFYGSSDQALDIAREADRWDVVHCGDFHEFTRLHPERLAFYSGSLERTSNNIWAETKPKGVVLYDTDGGDPEHLEVPTREMYDQEMIEDADAAELNDRLEVMSKDGHYKDALVRLKVEDFPREEREHIDWATVRALKSHCAHFYLDIRYKAPEVTDLGDRRGKKGLTLAEEAAAFFQEDLEEVRNLAIHYLDLQAETEEVEEEI